MDSCIFCKIGKGEIPVAKVYEDERTLAFLDIHPIAPGHTLVIPKAHAEEFIDMNDEDAAAVALTMKKVGALIKKTFGPPRVGSLTKGFDVAHTHVQLFPMTNGNDIIAAKYGPHFPPEAPIAELMALAEKMKTGHSA